MVQSSYQEVNALSVFTANVWTQDIDTFQNHYALWSAVWSTLQKYFIGRISFLDLGGCWLDPHGMSYHQSGQRHILVAVVNFVLIILLYVFQCISSKCFLSQCFTYWDDWLRLKENHKDRQFIRPEVCRTYNFGEHVCILTFLVHYLPTSSVCKQSRSIQGFVLIIMHFCIDFNLISIIDARKSYAKVVLCSLKLQRILEE